MKLKKKKKRRKFRKKPKLKPSAQKPKNQLKKPEEESGPRTEPAGEEPFRGGWVRRKRSSRPVLVGRYRETLELPTGKLVWVKVYLEHRNSVRYAIGSAGDLLVRLPANLSEEEGRRYVKEAKEWYLQQLKKSKSLEQKVAVVEYRDGQELRVMGEVFKLKLWEDPLKRRVNELLLEFDDPEALPLISIRLNPALSGLERNEVVSVLLTRFFSKAFLPKVEARVAFLSKQHFGDLAYGKVSIRDTKRQWGSCAQASRNLSFSVRLLFAPEEVFDYVIIHELAHILEPNHSPRFWALVERAMPDYHRHAAWLQQHGAGLKL